MTMKTIDKKKKILEQNRLCSFHGNLQNYIYDCFSQNLYPVKQSILDGIFGYNNSNLTIQSEKELNEFIDYLDKWNGTIKYAELLETRLTINLSNKCNLNCAYCYRDKENHSEMELAKAFEIIDYADKYYKTNNNEIVFSIDLTAEAFLDKEKIKTIYEKISDYKDHQKMRLWFMSNGTQITDEYIDLIKRIPIDPFWISLDGPEEIHNFNRKYYDKRGSFSDVINNIKKLQKAKVNIKISCVVTNHYPYPDKLFNYLKTLKVTGIQMCPVRNGCEVSLTTDSLDCMKISYHKLYEQLEKEILQGDYESVILLKEDFVMQSIYYLINRIKQPGRCTWGQEAVCNTDGDMYPCLYLIGNKKYCLGNISEKKNGKQFLFPITVNERDKCNNCWARYLCGGTCHYNAIVSKQSEYQTDDIECELRKFLVSESINLIIKLMEQKVDLKVFAKILNS